LGLLLTATPALALSKHTYSTSFAGSGTAALSDPADVALDQSTGDLYVADPANYRVEKFDSSEHFLLMFGKEVDETKVAEREKENSEHKAVTVTEEEENVCTAASGDTCQPGSSANGAPVPSPSQFSDPEFVAVDNSGGLSIGDVYVADTGGVHAQHGGTVSKFDSSGHSIATWGRSGQINLSTGYSNFYLDTPPGAQRSETPAGIAVDHAGNLLFSTTVSGSLFRFAQFGSFTSSFSTEGTIRATSLAAASGADLLAAGAGGVHQFTPTGADLGSLTGPGVSATAIAADLSDGQTYVADDGTVIRHYSAACDPSEGPCTPADSFGGPQLGKATGLAVDESTGIAYAADPANHRIDVYTPTPFLPDLTVGAAEPTAETATLNGKVDPAEAGEVTACKFQYTSKAAFQANHANEVQVLTLTGATGGTFTLGFEGQTTAALPYNASAAEVQSALEALSTIGAASVAVSGSEGGPYTVEFIGFLGDTDVPQLTADSSALAPPAATASVETTTPGGDGWGTAAAAPCLNEKNEEVDTHPIPTSAPTNVHAGLTGLTAETAYRYRLIAANSNGTALSHARTFTPHVVIGLTTEPPTHVSGGAATLNGSFLGDGEETKYYFEWGTTEAYGKQTAKEATSATGPQSPSSNLTELAPNTEYHYRVIAENESGETSNGEDQNFTTPPNLPLISAESATEVHSDSARINAEVDPGAGDTIYHVEYGTEACSTRSCASSPLPGLPAGQGTAFVPAVVPLQGLASATVYHYRLLAQNVAGTTYGPERTFTTLPFVKLENDPCINAHVRQQTGAAALPDCRAYELVSASNSGGYDVESSLIEGQAPYGGYPEAEGHALYGVHDGGIPGTDHPTNRGVDPYVATRGKEGWSTEYVGVPANLPGTSGSAPFSSTPSDAAAGLETFAFGAAGSCSPCFEGGYTGVPVRLPNGKLVQGMVGSENPGPLARSEGSIAEDLSANGEHFVFGSKSKFEPDANEGELSIYDRNLKTEETHVVSKTPTGQPMKEEGSEIGELDISKDGSHILIGHLVEEKEGAKYWHLYINVGDGSKTIDLTPGAIKGVLFDGITADGSKVFISSEEHLTGEDKEHTGADIFMWEEGHPLTLISKGSGHSCDPAANSAHEHWNTAGSQENCGVVAIGGGGGVSSANGTIYFLSPEQLAGSGHGTLNAPNLYRAGPADGYATHYVTTLESFLNTPQPPKLRRTFAHDLPEAFAGATGLAVEHSSGDLYVLNAATNTVGKFDSSGNPVNFTEGAGVGTNQLSGAETPAGSFEEFAPLGLPTQLAVNQSNGDLYVPDLFHGAVDVFSSSGKYLSQITGLSFPSGVTVDSPNGDVYVTNYFGGVSVFEASGNPISSFSTNGTPSGVAVDPSSGDIYVTNSPEGGSPSETVAYNSAGKSKGTLDPHASASVAVDPSTGDVYVDEGQRIAVYNSSGNLIETLGTGDLTGSLGLAIDPEGNLYATNSGGGEVALFTASLAPSPLIDNPAVLDSVAEPETRHSADFQLTPNGAYAAFPSTVPLTGYESGEFPEIYRYDASAGGEEGHLDCVSCDPANGAATGDASLASNGLSLTDDGRVFFTTADALAAGDTDNKTDVYEWEPQGTGTCQSESPTFNKAIGACLGLISAGTSTFDSGLLSADAKGTDVYFFTRDSLVPQDKNGPTMKIYDARVEGGFPYEYPPGPCKASDECHGASSPIPAPLEVGSESSTPGIGNYSEEPKTKPCKKGFVRKHGTCVMTSKPHKHKAKHHKRAAHHKRGGSK